jgi:hypothetical protein
MENKYYRPYLNYSLTEAGIVMTDGEDNHYVATYPNDHKVTKLVNEVKSLWDKGDIDGFLRIVYDKKDNWGSFTFEEMVMFEGTRFGDPITCVDWIEEELSIKSFQMN